MAFCIHPDESIPRGLRRLARKELKTAAEVLSDAAPADNRVHEARTSVKKVRAIVQLLDSDGTPHLRRVRKQLRQVSGVLSPLRDASAIQETLKQLRQSDPGLFSRDAYAEIKRQLSADATSLHDDARHSATWSRGHRQLKALAKAAKEWRPRHRGLKALGRGLLDTHRRARRALEQAERSGRADDFHELRKALKTLWYQLRIVDSGQPAIHTDVDALHAAESALGDDHNMAVLVDRLRRAARPRNVEIDADRLSASAGRCQDDLRKKALADVRYILESGSRAYVRAVQKALKERTPATTKDDTTEPPGDALRQVS